jgi:two-component system response regulator RegA
MPDARSLLLVEDDDALRTRLARAFADRGFAVRDASTVADAERAAREVPPALVVLDLRVGAESGLDLVPALKALDPATRIVVLTGYGSVATAVRAVKLGAANYLTKPADADEILAAFGELDDPSPAVETSPMSLGRLEWEHINRVVSECAGNISEAARRLGLHRRTLQRKLSKHPLPR